MSGSACVKLKEGEKGTKVVQLYLLDVLNTLLGVECAGGINKKLSRQEKNIMKRTMREPYQDLHDGLRPNAVCLKGDLAEVLKPEFISSHRALITQMFLQMSAEERVSWYKALMDYNIERLIRRLPNSALIISLFEGIKEIVQENALVEMSNASE